MEYRVGKRYKFAVVAVCFVSLVTVYLGYAGEIYLKLIATIVGVYTIGQTYTDAKKNNT